ncbi:hypothetical protein ABT160_39985 [Streptomyces sp. NPDC001941]|uniref:hypothetical protein n=1 Tax=Streptomyces sp. NPDC001941 TaxID=3154659 RepID=UPI0033300172
MSTPHEVTPAALRDLSAAAEALAERIEAAHAALRAAEGTAQVGFLLDAAAGRVRDAAAALQNTSEDLARARTGRDPNLCGVPWGICPEHGNTLTVSGGKTWCSSLACGRIWPYDRLSTPCAEPVRFKVSIPHGGVSRICGAHAREAAERMEGVVVEPLG